MPCRNHSILVNLGLVLGLVLGTGPAARADRYDDTLDLLGLGARSNDEVVEAVVLTGSQRLAERLLARLPDDPPLTVARAGDLARLELALLANPRRLEMESPDREKSILEAAAGGPVERRKAVVGYLLERELDAKNEQPQLDRAIREGRGDIVEAYCEVKRLRPLLATALHDACWQKRTTIAKTIIAADVDVTEARTWGFQAIHAAMYRREDELVELLLEHGAAVDVFVAAGLGRTKTMNELLEAGVPSNFGGSVGPHPAFFAARTGQISTLEPFLADRNVLDRTGHRSFNLLIAAAETAPAEVIERLLEAGIDRSHVAILFDDKRATALHFAAANGNVDAARALMEAGVDVDVKTERGATPLHVAANFGQHDFVEMLIEANADVDAERNGTESPLYVAAEQGHVAVATLLLDAGANVDGVGKSPLRIAIANDRVEVAKLLLERGSNELASSANVPPERVPVTPLGLAASNGSPELVQTFLDLGQDPDRVQGIPEAEMTPVLAALRAERGDNALLLLEAGGTVRPARRGEALRLVGRLGRVDLLDALLASGIDLDAPVTSLKEPRPTAGSASQTLGRGALLAGAIECDRADVVRHVAALGIDLDVRVDGDNTPLSLAASHDARQSLRALLEAGADPNRPPFVPELTPIVVAMQSGGVEAVRLLVEHGAQPASRGGVHLAALLGRMDVVEAAIERDAAELLVKREPLGSPLAWAAKGGQLEIVRRLIEVGGASAAFYDSMPEIVATGDVKLVGFLAENGVSVNGPVNEYGEPLRVAIHSRDPKLVATLLEHRANPNGVRNSIAWTPLQEAATRGLPEITTLLLDAGAHVNGLGFDKRSALDLALDASAYSSRPGETTETMRGTPEDKLKVANLLLDAGARARVGKPGKVSYAATVGEPDLLARLLETGGDANEIDERRRTTPLLAALDGRKGVPRTASNEERTARERAFESVIEKLLAAGADPRKAGPDGRIPLSLVQRPEEAALLAMFEKAVAARSE